MSTVLQDLNYGVRMLGKNRGFAVVAILTLALGIGGCTSIFGVMAAILLTPLPLREAQRVMIVLPQGVGKAWGETLAASRLDFSIWRNQNHVFEGVAASSFRPASLTVQQEPQRVQELEVSANYFAVLGVQPVLGRTFLAGEDQRGHGPLVVLSHELWEQSYGSDPGVIGKPVSLDGAPATVIGVMPADFELPFFPSDIWVLAPDESSALTPEMGAKRSLLVLARLKPGVTVEAARAEVATMALRIQHDYPGTHEGWSATVMPLEEFLIRIARVRGRLAVLAGVGMFVLLIACANVAGLLVARGEARHQEIAVRAALGAGRWRLVRQMLVESLLLAILGGGLGLLLSSWGLDAFKAGYHPGDYPRLWFSGMTIDTRVLGVALALAVMTAILFGLPPALRGSTPDLQTALKQGGRSASGGRGQNRLRRWLVAGEISLTLVLTIGAGLMIRNVLDSLNAGLRFDPDRVLTASVSLAGARYDHPAQQADFFAQVLERAAHLPGVESACLTSNLPLSYAWQTDFTTQLASGDAGRTAFLSSYYVVSPNYFRTLGIPLLAGRAFADSDNLSTQAVALVNEALARRFFPGKDPIGERIRVEAGGANPPAWREIVGVVGNVQEWPGQPAASPQIYVPYRQRPVLSLIVAVRSAGHAAALAPALRAAVRSVDKDQPVEDLRSMTQVIARRMGAVRLQTLWMGMAAGLALLLAAVGIYGIVAYSVSRRIHEIGIRMSLGAQRHQVFTLIFREGVALVAVGLAAGLITALPLPWILGSTIPRFVVRAPLVFIGVPVVVAAIALLATYIPARRATQVDPIVALRYE
jgi:putative ABC transport system permease protein